MWRAILRKKTILLGMLVCLGSLHAADFSLRERLRDVNAYFDAEGTRLYQTVEKGDLEKARNLVIEGTKLESKGPQTEDQNTHQITLLSYALAKGDKATAKNFMAIGANPLVRPGLRMSNSFLFLVARSNVDMLDYLYQEWPVSKIGRQDQALQSFYALNTGCQSCLELMFRRGISPHVVDDRGYNIFMEALSNEDWDSALWLLTTIKVSPKAEASNGVTPANAVQFNMYRVSSSSVAYEKLSLMKNYMEKNYGIKFPVETSLQIRNKK